MGTTFSKFRITGASNFDAPSQYFFSITGKAKKFDREQEIVALRHNLVREIFESNFLAPIRNELEYGGLNVLDVGCGFGTWLFEMSSDFKKCNFVGVDITAQLFNTNKPRNVNFVTADITDKLPFRDESFDLVFIRNLIYDMKETQWAPLIKECARILKSGGYIEITETELKLNESGPIASKLHEKIKSFLKSKQINGLIINEMEEIIRSTRKFQDVIRYERIMPIGSWYQRLGDAFEEYYDNTLRSSLKITDLKPENYEDEIRKIKAEINEYRTYINIYKYVSQKA